MNQTPPPNPQKAGAPAAQALPASPSIWQRINDDLHKRPRWYLNVVLVLSLVLLGVVLAFKFWRAKQADSLTTIAQTWNDAWASDQNAKARAASLEDLRTKVTTDSERATLLLELAGTWKEIATSAENQADMVAAYEKTLAYCAELKSKYPNSLWAKLPIKPPTPGAPAPLSAVSQIEDFAKRQLAWLKDHPYEGIVEPDANLTVTFELEDGRKLVVGKLFSRAAPYHVQNFVELARSGYFDGTGFSRVAQGFKKGVTGKQGERPPNISLEGGHPFTKLSPENRDDDDTPADIGYSVPDEPNSLSPKRGSLVAAQDTTSGGDSASRFKIYADEPPTNYETVFAEITEGLDVLDSIVNAPSPEMHPSWTKDLVRVKKATVQGSVLKPPERPFPPAPILPEPPKVESRPSDSRPESGPESRDMPKTVDVGPDTKGPDTKPR